MTPFPDLVSLWILWLRSRRRRDQPGVQESHLHPQHGSKKKTDSNQTQQGENHQFSRSVLPYTYSPPFHPSETLEELIALRKLTRKPTGIDLVRLNAGEKKKKVKSAKESEDVGTIGPGGMIEGSIGGITGGGKGKDRIMDE